MIVNNVLLMNVVVEDQFKEFVLFVKVYTENIKMIVDVLKTLLKLKMVVFVKKAIIYMMVNAHNVLE